MTELRTAVAIEWLSQKEARAIYKAEVILDSRADLLEENGVVQPIHYSVREFFTTLSQDGISHKEKDFVFEASEIEAEMTIVCKWYLICFDNWIRISPEKLTLSIGIFCKHNPLALYCSQNFDQHIHCVGKLPERLKKC